MNWDLIKPLLNDSLTGFWGCRSHFRPPGLRGGRRPPVMIKIDSKWSVNGHMYSP